MNTRYPLLSTTDELYPSIRLFESQTGVEWRCLRGLVYMEGQHNYTWLHWDDTPKILVPYTLKRFVEKLPVAHFGRIHRKFMINYSFVAAWELRHKACCAVLSSGTRLPISRRYRALFKQKAAFV